MTEVCSVFQLVVINVQTGQMTAIPLLQSSEESVPAVQPCGIHGIAINPSGTMLATGASHTNDIGIYKLPTFDPFCVGEVSLEFTGAWGWVSPGWNIFTFHNACVCTVTYVHACLHIPTQTYAHILTAAHKYVYLCVHKSNVSHDLYYVTWLLGNIPQIGYMHSVNF